MKKIYYQGRIVNDGMRYECSSIAKGFMRKMLNSYNHDVWNVYGDRTSTYCVITSKELNEDNLVLVGSVEYTETEDAIRRIRELVAQWRKDLYCCKTTAIKMTKDKEILDKAYVCEKKNPYYSCAAPMQLYNRYYIQYLVEKKVG